MFKSLNNWLHLSSVVNPPIFISDSFSIYILWVVLENMGCMLNKKLFQEFFLWFSDYSPCNVIGKDDASKVCDSGYYIDPDNIKCYTLKLPSSGLFTHAELFLCMPVLFIVFILIGKHCVFTVGLAWLLVVRNFKF